MLADGDIPTAKKFSGLFHCPYCKYKGAKYIIDYHIRGHSSVKHRGAYRPHYTFFVHYLYVFKVSVFFLSFISFRIHSDQVWLKLP